jgi:hypothetical protein
VPLAGDQVPGHGRQVAGAALARRVLVTAVSMVRSFAAVSGETTRTASGRGRSTSTPSGPVVEEMIRGGMRSPSLATVWYMPAICRVVMVSPWPIGRLPNVLPDQDSRGGTTPGLSPGSSMPVRVPMPNRASISENRSSPTSRAVIRVPTLDDLASTPVSV